MPVRSAMAVSGRTDDGAETCNQAAPVRAVVACRLGAGGGNWLQDARQREGTRLSVTYQASRLRASILELLTMTWSRASPQIKKGSFFGVSHCSRVFETALAATQLSRLMTVSPVSRTGTVVRAEPPPCLAVGMTTPFGRPQPRKLLSVERTEAR